MPIQLVGRYCVACGNKIVADTEGRICPQCEKPFHLTCVAEAGTCPDCHLKVQTGEDFRSLRSTYSTLSRPVTVTVIGWLLIAIGLISAVAGTVGLASVQVQDLMKQSPIPVPLQVALMYLGLVITVVSGMGILMGKKRARLLYVVWSAFSILFGLATSPMKLTMLPALIVYVVFVLLLFNRAANEFFALDEPTT